jgi:FKBP-type peptidyl-prolyl cis-trans isomerase SlyD
LKVGAQKKVSIKPARPIRAHEVKEKTIVVDLNHPLAGKTLNFDVKVTDITTAEAR